MAQLLRVHKEFAEDQGLIPRIHTEWSQTPLGPRLLVSSAHF